MEKPLAALELASGTQRLLNYFFDFVFIKVISLSILLAAGTFGILVPHQWFFKFFFVLNIRFLYYAAFEGVCGQTLGKIATGTMVVAVDGNRPDFSTILLRTLCRF